MQCPACKSEIDDSATRCRSCGLDIITVTGVGKGSQAAILGGLAGAAAGAFFGILIGHWLINAIILGSILAWVGYTKGMTQKRAVNLAEIRAVNEIRKLSDSVRSQPNISETDAFRGDSNLLKFKGDRVIQNDSYKIYLTKKFKFEKNEILGKIICEDALFDNIEDALNHAARLDTEQFILEQSKMQSEDFPLAEQAAPDQLEMESEEELMEKYRITFDDVKKRYYYKVPGSPEVDQGQPFYDLADAIDYARKKEGANS